MAGYLFSREPQPVPPVATRFRQIATAIPAPGTAEVLARLDAFESRSMHGQMPIVWDRAEDFSIFDGAGNRWIDFTSTIFVANVGHANPRVRAALAATLEHELCHSYAYATAIRARYLERLVAFAPAPLDKAFLLSAGTEATEAALKLMRLHGHRTGKRRLGILCIEGNWHGRTLGAQMMSGGGEQPVWVGAGDPDIHHIPFPYPWALGNRSGEAFLAEGLGRLAGRGIDLAQDVAGVMLETFQGWGAVFYPPDFVQALAALCRRHGIALAFDEMQAGFGRTGRRFGFEHYGVDADLICVGKGMGGGFPISGVIGRAEIMDLPAIGEMSSTHSANPLACAAGLATLAEIEERDLVAQAAAKGRRFFAALSDLQARFPDRIGWVLGHGLIAALHFSGERAQAGAFCSRVAERCMQKGVLVVHTGRESIKLGPPLTIAEDALLEGVATIGEAIAEIAREG